VPVGVYLTALVNSYKESEKHPDFRILPHRDGAGLGAAAGVVASVGVAPLEAPSQDDIPF
jgi:uncharacterized protein (DUF736 family)